MRFSRKWMWLAAVAAVVLLIAIPATAGAQYTNYQQSAGDQYGQPSGTAAVAAKTCVSKRRFRLTLRARSGRFAVRARATLNGRALRVRRQKGRRTVLIDLRGRKAGTVTVRVTGRTRKGKRFTRTHRYRICAKASQSTKVVIVNGKPTSATTTPASGLPGGSALAVLGIALLGGGALTAAGMRVRKRR